MGADMACSIDWEDHGLLLNFSGSWTGEDFLKITHELYADSRHSQLDYIIADFSNVDSLNVSDEVVSQQSLMDMAASVSNPNTKVALVAKSKKLEALTNLYRQESEGSSWLVQRFDRMQEARAWVAE